MGGARRLTLTFSVESQTALRTRYGGSGVLVVSVPDSHARESGTETSVLVECESPMPSSGSVLGLNPTKAFGFSVEGWCALKKGICLLPFQRNKFEQCHLRYLKRVQ